MPIPVAIATSTRPRSRRKVGFAPKSDLDALKASYPNLHAQWVSLGVVKA
jgi:hypothetical protein